MKSVPHASVVGSLTYVIVCMTPDMSYIVCVVSRFFSNPGEEYRSIVK